MILSSLALIPNRQVPALLDTYSGAIGAFSLRRLRTAYTGYAMQVRRSSDDQLLDVGFNGSGELDTVSLLAFVGSGDGFVSKWYDQSGYNNFAYQNNFANQPIIVSSGVVRTNGTKPSIYWDSPSPHMLIINNNVWSGVSGIRSAFINIKWVTGSGLSPILGETSDGMYHADTTGANLILSEAYASPNIKYGALYINNVSKNLNEFYRNINTNQLVTMIHLDATGYLNQLTRDRGDTSSYFKGYYTEIVLYGTDQTSNRNAISQDINTFYSIY